MSPHEFDLRSALRDGEGDSPDPDTVLAAGRLRASQRRTRIAATTGAVAGVIAVGTTGAIVLGRDGGGSGSHDAAGRTGTTVSDVPAAGSLAPTGARQIVPVPTGGVTADPGYGIASPGATPPATAACPTSFPSTLLPGGGGSGQFGSGERLFPADVRSVLVCGFGSTGTTAKPGSATLLGDRAQELVQSLESASTRKPSVACPDYRIAGDHRFAFVGVTADGTALRAVTTTVGGGPACDVRVTNGTAIRYAWSPPADLVRSLYAIGPK